MPDNNNGKDLLNEQVTFIQNHLPGLDAGEYQLTVQQQIFESDTTTPVSGDAFSNQYSFAVPGDRFSIGNPGQTLNSVFPAGNSSGEFSAVFPHAVFNKKTFPWIRFPTTDQPKVEGGADIPTWLWVMLLDEDDAAEFGGLNLSPVQRTIAGLVAGNLDSGPAFTSYFASEAAMEDDLDPGQTPTDKINTIDLPIALFQSLAPSLDDLKLMAHGRTVSLVNQSTGPALSTVQPTGDFSIVMSNRLPANGKANYAYLVSLEGLEALLPGYTGPLADTGQAAWVRLAVLKNWKFFSAGEPAAFVNMVEKLNGRKSGQDQPDAPNTTLTVNYTGSNPDVANALAMGYVPLNQGLRTGGQTVSWYRGPLTPYQVEKLDIQFPITSTDAATVFDPTTGMLDTSYAAAWTLGRMLALQDKSFSTALYNWKKELEAAITRKTEEELMRQEFGCILEPDGATEQLNAGNILIQTLKALQPKS